MLKLVMLGAGVRAHQPDHQRARRRSWRPRRARHRGRLAVRQPRATKPLARCRSPGRRAEGHARARGHASRGIRRWAPLIGSGPCGSVRRDMSANDPPGPDPPGRPSHRRSLRAPTPRRRAGRRRVTRGCGPRPPSPSSRSPWASGACTSARTPTTRRTTEAGRVGAADHRDPDPYGDHHAGDATSVRDADHVERRPGRARRRLGGRRRGVRRCPPGAEPERRPDPGARERGRQGQRRGRQGPAGRRQGQAGDREGQAGGEQRVAGREVGGKQARPRPSRRRPRSVSSEPRPRRLPRARSRCSRSSARSRRPPTSTKGSSRPATRSRRSHRNARTPSPPREATDLGPSRRGRRQKPTPERQGRLPTCRRVSPGAVAAGVGAGPPASR